MFELSVRFQGLYAAQTAARYGGLPAAQIGAISQASPVTPSVNNYMTAGYVIVFSLYVYCMEYTTFTCKVVFTNFNVVLWIYI